MLGGCTTLGPVRVAWATSPRSERSETGGALLARLVRELFPTGEIGEVGRSCPRCGSTAHGAPLVRGVPVAVSVSYADEMVAVAAVPTTDAAAVGVDIEATASESRAHQLALLFHPQPPPDLRGWTLIEAALKADRRGLNVDVSTVTRVDARSSILGPASIVTVPGQPATIAAAAVDGPEGYLLSVAVLADSAGPAAAARSAMP